VASGRLGRPHAGCDRQPTVPDLGRFVTALLWSVRLKQLRAM
jgi:hypothetical protein